MITYQTTSLLSREQKRRQLSSRRCLPNSSQFPTFYVERTLELWVEIQSVSTRCTSERPTTTNMAPVFVYMSIYYSVDRRPPWDYNAVTTFRSAGLKSK